MQLLKFSALVGLAGLAAFGMASPVGKAAQNVEREAATCSCDEPAPTSTSTCLSSTIPGVSVIVPTSGWVPSVTDSTSVSATLSFSVPVVVPPIITDTATGTATGTESATVTGPVASDSTSGVDTATVPTPTTSSSASLPETGTASASETISSSTTDGSATASATESSTGTEPPAATSDIPVSAGASLAGFHAMGALFVAIMVIII